MLIVSQNKDFMVDTSSGYAIYTKPVTYDVPKIGLYISLLGNDDEWYWLLGNYETTEDAKAALQRIAELAAMNQHVVFVEGSEKQ